VQASGEYKCRPEIKLLEYDERFAVFKEFVYYDFEKAVQLPPEMKASFDHIICDPPFLSEDCQTKGMHKLLVNYNLTDDISGFDCALAGKILDAGVPSPHRLYGRAHGEFDHYQALRQNWNSDDRLRDLACKGLEQ
jgi:hypothetical protein